MAPKRISNSFRMMVTQPPSPPPPPLPPPPMSRQAATMAAAEPVYANSRMGGAGRRTPSPVVGAGALLELPPNLVIMNTPPTPGQEQVHFIFYCMCSVRL